MPGRAGTSGTSDCQSTYEKVISNQLLLVQVVNVLFVVLASWHFDNTKSAILESETFLEREQIESLQPLTNSIQVTTPETQ